MFAIRPEKIHLREDTDAGDLPVRARGVVDAVVYLGSVNHHVVRLDGGGTLTVLRQNLHGAADQKVGAHGDRVALAWDDEHLIDLTPIRPRDRGRQRLGQPPGGIMKITGHAGQRTLAGMAALGLVLAASLAACGTSSGGDSSGTGTAAEEQGGFTPPDVPMAQSLDRTRALLGARLAGLRRGRAAPTSRSTGSRRSRRRPAATSR